MRSNVVRVLVGIGLIVVAIVLLVVLKGTDNGTSEGDSEPAESTVEPAGKTNEPGAGTEEEAVRVPTIAVRNGKPVGGVKELTYGAGDQIRFKVESDVSDEVHIHGYDLMKDVAAGRSVSFSFPAEIEGIFEVELEDHQEQIAEIRVNP